MIGKGVLLECLDHESVTEVLSISRRSLEIDHPKLKELIHADFSEFDSVKGQLVSYDAVFCCMGVSAAGMTEENYTRLTHDYTMALARTLIAINPEMTLTYVSGQGTDSSEKGRSMWARVKGRLENDLLRLGFKGAFMYRPGGIIPLKGIQPSSRLYRVLITYLKWLLYLMKALAPNSIVDTTQIGLSMINIVQTGYEKKIIDPKDIIATAK